VYDKIQRGDLLLSPYAWWELSLTPAKQDVNFTVLEEFKNKVHLKLVGVGTYVSRASDAIDYVGEYYKDNEIEIE
jgi:hypothetical protein